MATLRLWVSATRPKTLFASIAPILIGISFALSEGYCHGTILLLSLIEALLIQISTNFANDYFDALKGADTPERKGPSRLMASGLVSSVEMKRALLALFTATALVGCLLSYYGGPIIALLTGISLILALLYTAGPYPLAYVGLGDVFVFVFFGLIATSATYYLQTKVLTPEVFFAGIIPGSLSTAILAINNLRDIDEDRAANKKTLAVRFGEKFTKWEFMILIALSYGVALGFCFFYPTTLLSLITLPYAMWLCKKVLHNTDKLELNICLFETGKLLFYTTLLFSIGKML